MMTGTGGGGRDGQFEAIYRKHYGRVYRFFRGCGVADDEAHDLSQDTFKRMYEKFDQYRGEAEWAFLEKTARNVFLNWLRAMKTAKRSAETVDIDDPDFNYEPAAPEEPDYAERQQQTLRRARLREAMGELSDGQRQCLRLLLQGDKYHEIAKKLRVSDDAVKSRIRDAKKHLRERMGGDQ